MASDDMGLDLVDVIELVIERRGDGEVVLGDPTVPRRLDVDLTLLLSDGLDADDAVLEVGDEREEAAEVGSREREDLAWRLRVHGGHARRGVHQSHLAEEGVGLLLRGRADAVGRVRVEQRQLHVGLEDAQLAVQQDVELVARPALLEDGHLCGGRGVYPCPCACVRACMCLCMHLYMHASVHRVTAWARGRG
eukprot:scaffold125585_cov45-Phaeocystis_antarctica.AAC.1